MCFYCVANKSFGLVDAPATFTCFLTYVLAGLLLEEVIEYPCSYHNHLTALNCLHNTELVVTFFNTHSMDNL